MLSKFSISETIAEIFPSDISRFAFLESEGSSTLELLPIFYKVALISPY